MDTEGRITKRNLENTIYYSYNQEGQQTASKTVRTAIETSKLSRKRNASTKHLDYQGELKNGIKIYRTELSSLKRADLLGGNYVAYQTLYYIQYKSGKDWMAYAKKRYGIANFFGNLINDLSIMSDANGVPPMAWLIINGLSLIVPRYSTDYTYISNLANGKQNEMIPVCIQSQVVAVYFNSKKKETHRKVKNYYI